MDLPGRVVSEGNAGMLFDSLFANNTNANNSNDDVSSSQYSLKFYSDCYSV